MRRFNLFVLAMAMLFPSSLLAAEVELRVDGVVTGMETVAVQAGALNGERVGLKLDTAPGDYPLTVKHVTVLYADQLGLGSATNDTFVTFYDATGTNGLPGNQIGVSSGEYTLNASETMLNQLDLTADNIMIPSGPFVVVLDVNRPAPCSIVCTDSYVTDTDGLVPQTNIVWNITSSEWAYLESFGAASGDWIIRVTVETSNGTTMDMDMPMDMAMDMAVDMPVDMGMDMAVGDTGPDTPNPADMSGDTGADAPSDMGDTVVTPGTLSVTQITPNMAQSGTSPLVQIRGTGFVDGTTMRLDATALEGIEVVSPTVINATIPGSLMAGTYDLIAQNPNGELFTFPAAFVITDDPVDGGGDDGCGCTTVRDQNSAPWGALALAFGVVGFIGIRRRRTRV